jgi:hypothetical protein
MLSNLNDSSVNYSRRDSNSSNSTNNSEILNEEQANTSTSVLNDELSEVRIYSQNIKLHQPVEEITDEKLDDMLKYLKDEYGHYDEDHDLHKTSLFYIILTDSFVKVILNNNNLFFKYIKLYPKSIKYISYKYIKDAVKFSEISVVSELIHRKRLVNVELFNLAVEYKRVDNAKLILNKLVEYNKLELLTVDYFNLFRSHEILKYFINLVIKLKLNLEIVIKYLIYISDTYGNSTDTVYALSIADSYTIEIISPVVNINKFQLYYKCAILKFAIIHFNSYMINYLISDENLEEINKKYSDEHIFNLLQVAALANNFEAVSIINNSLKHD